MTLKRNKGLLPASEAEEIAKITGEQASTKPDSLGSEGLDGILLFDKDEDGKQG